jgi:peptidase M23-like protein
MTTRRLRATALLTGLLVAIALLVTALPSAPSRAAAPASTTASAAAVLVSAATPDPAHPYSDPVWFPLHGGVKIGCVYSNCPGPYHGYWAIDFGGQLDDPLYAAGAGVFHIGAIDNTCPATGTKPGTWVWIDHGPAGVTSYEHLNRVLATEGQLVTPATEIGTMGHNGNTAPCHAVYTHMEFRAQRLGGTRLPIPTMYGCVGGTKEAFPAAFGYSSWNSVPNMTVTTPNLTTTCMPSVNATPNRPHITVVRGVRSALVTPEARPAGTERWRVRVEMYHPSLHRYGLPTYNDHLPTTPAVRLLNLSSGYTYRISAAFHNGVGWSAWAYSWLVVPQ